MTKEIKKQMTQQEIWTALSINGETIINEQGEKYKFINGSLNKYDKTNDLWIQSSNCFSITSYFSIYKESQWTDQLPCLCMVWDDEKDDAFPALVVFYDEVGTPYQTNEGSWYENAEPMTNDYWEKYRAKI